MFHVERIMILDTHCACARGPGRSEPRLARTRSGAESPGVALVSLAGRNPTVSMDAGRRYRFPLCHRPPSGNSVPLAYPGFP
ncbi:hypothetical protein OpiT1DRAFT_03857 [Opitutaceae bacterium TAV1]|nr:hypothetical protein OpiT1DRAFT_03857 [Opitutaceae bacterium TAV1]